MVQTEIHRRDVERAEARMQAEREIGYAVSARYDPREARLVVKTDTGIELAVPVRLVEGLADGSDDDLSEIEISGSGLGLHWPKLDADIYVPGLLRGIYGSPRWMAALRRPAIV